VVLALDAGSAAARLFFQVDEPVDGARKAAGSLLNVVQAAGEWQVPRVGMASTVGVYGGVTAEPPYREDLPLPMTAGHVIPAFKKAGELLTDYLAGATGIEILSYRISPWGPTYIEYLTGPGGLFRVLAWHCG
jgi:UDP-glucose 4-epimerase